MLLDAAQIASEPLERRARAAPLGQLVPGAAHSPRRRVDAEAARGEAVGEDLVDDGLEMPRRPTVMERQHEVVRVRDIVVDDAGAVEPGVSDLATRQEPAVVGDRITHREPRDPRVLALSL